jgi:MtN3 and saliva related transmembrane protein
MQVNVIEIVGAAAALLTTAAYLPQAVRLIARRETAAVSLTMYLMMAVGVALWLAYGVVLGSWPLMIGNGVTLALSLTIIATKLRYG